MLDHAVAHLSPRSRQMATSTTRDHINTGAPLADVRHLRRGITYIRYPVLGYRRTTGLQRKHGSSVHTSGHTSGVIRCSVRADTPAGNMAPAETRSIHGSSGHTIITTSSYQHHSIQDLRVRSWLRAQRAVHFSSFPDIPKAPTRHYGANTRQPIRRCNVLQAL